MSVKTADFFRALDDSGLDVYETRYLLRVWRRGKCWEKLQSISETTGMSVGKASKVRRDLVAAGWLTEVIHEGHVAYEVAIPDCCSVSCGETEFHEVKPEFHQVKPEFHVVHALPINRQKEDHNTKSAPPAPADPELQAAKDATFALIEFWAELTKRQYPAPASVDFRDKWLKPFNAIWIMCGRDVEAAKAKVQAVRADMANRGITIFDPAKLPAHVQVLVDAELRPMTERMNGNGAGDVTAERESLWQRAIREIGAGWVEDALLRQAIQAVGGSSSIKQANEFTTRQLKERLFHEYHRNAATA